MPILLFDGDVGHDKCQFRALANGVLGISMAESTLEAKNLIPSATGPAGSIPMRHFARVAAMRMTSMGSRGFAHARDVAAMHMAVERNMRLTTAISGTPHPAPARNHLTRNGFSPRSISLKIERAEDRDRPSFLMKVTHRGQSAYRA